MKKVKKSIDEVIKHNEMINKSLKRFLKYKAMSSYCLKCKKNTESIDRRVSKNNNGKALSLSKCAICGSKKSTSIKTQQISGILRNLGLKTLLNKIPLLGDILF